MRRGPLNLGLAITLVLTACCQANRRRCRHRARPTRPARLVVVILSGRPVILDRVLPTPDAVIAAWLPGTEGAGVVDVLLGDAPFSGTTPYTWPTTPEDAPRTGKAACDGAIFPLGYGLDLTGKLLGPAACS